MKFRHWAFGTRKPIYVIDVRRLGDSAGDHILIITVHHLDD